MGWYLFIIGSPLNKVINAVLIIVFCRAAVGDGGVLTLINNCGETVWPGILAGAGSAALSTTGFELRAGERRTVGAPPGWSGRLWARTSCRGTDGGGLVCGTGDCGSGPAAECEGRGPDPPVTLAEFTLGGDTDFYDVSLVDGYNLPLAVEPAGGSCPAAGCPEDVGALCPVELRAGNGACRSACDAFRQPEFCCSGDFGSPGACPPSPYSQLFKAACPLSYSYAFDDPTSIFTCAATAGFTITFCPHPFPSKKASADQLSAMLENNGQSWLANLAAHAQPEAKPPPISSSFLVSFFLHIYFNHS